MGRSAVRRDAAIEFGMRVAKHRHSRGLTQRDVAEVALIDVRYLSDVENGKRNISLENVVRIAYALGADVGTLTRGLKPTWD